MLKQILPLLFTFIFSINLFAESHDIHREISDIKLQLQEIKLLDTRDEREKKIEKLERKVDDLKELDFKKLEEKIENKKNKSWTPSDIGTIMIAILTIFLAVASLLSAWFLWKQYKEQKSINENNLKLLEKGQKLNQLENQIFHQINFLDNMLMKREFNIELIEYSKKTFDLIEDNDSVTENKIRIYNKNGKEIVFFKGNFNTYINMLENKNSGLSKEDIEIILKNVSSLKSEMILFSYKLKSLKRILDKSKDVDYDIDLIQISFDLYYSYASTLNKYKILNDEVFNYYKERITNKR